MTKKHGAPPTQRQLRVGEEIRHALARILARGGLRDPDLFDVAITVTEVRASPDLRQVTAFVTPLGGVNMETVVAALGRAAPYLQGQIGRELRLRSTPHLSFQPDRSFEQAGRIDQVLRELDHDDNRNDGGDGA